MRLAGFGRQQITEEALQPRRRAPYLDIPQDADCCLACHAVDRRDKIHKIQEYETRIGSRRTQDHQPCSICCSPSATIF
jgi:hypothetical protein